jgi:hypothetical protein
MFLSNSKANTWPTEIDLLLCAISYSPNLNKFVKVVCNVVFSSLWHSRGIGLEGETHSMFVKWKLDGNSHKFDKDVYTINILITNYLLPSTHQSLDSLCITFLALKPNVGSKVPNNLHEEIPANIIPLRSHYVPTTLFGVGTQFKVPIDVELCSTRSLTSSKENQYNKNHLLYYCLCKWCYLMFNIHKTKGINYSPLLPWTTLRLTPSPRPWNCLFSFALVIWFVVSAELC